MKKQIAFALGALFVGAALNANADGMSGGGSMHSPIHNLTTVTGGAGGLAGVTQSNSQSSSTTQNATGGSVDAGKIIAPHGTVDINTSATNTATTTQSNTQAGTAEANGGNATLTTPWNSGNHYGWNKNNNRTSVTGGAGGTATVDQTNTQTSTTNQTATGGDVWAGKIIAPHGTVTIDTSASNSATTDQSSSQTGTASANGGNATLTSTHHSGSY